VTTCIFAIDSFLMTPTAGRGAQSDLYPSCIQAQRTVEVSKSKIA
jgi:hypothetical protein